MIADLNSRHAFVEVSAVLVTRVRSEYLEMPGLTLTVWQASRLWGVDIETAEHVLTRLVETGFLWRTREGAYVRRAA